MEIKKGKTIKLAKEYIIINFATNEDNNEPCVILQDTKSDLLTVMSLSKLENLLLEQEKKKNSKKQKLEPKPEDKVIDKKLLTEAKRRLKIIKAVINTNSLKEKEKIAKKHNIHLSTIYRWIEKYEKNGRTIFGLIPEYKKRGGKGKKRIEEKALKIINKIITEKYGTVPVKKIHEEINTILIKENLKPISYTALLNYVKDIIRDSINNKKS